MCGEKACLRQLIHTSTQHNWKTTFIKSVCREMGYSEDGKCMGVRESRVIVLVIWGIYLFITYSLASQVQVICIV